MLYILRTSPCAGNIHLQEFDNVLRSGLETILNVQLSDVQWKQASLPVHIGGLGMRSAVSLAPSAFLASATATLPLQKEILSASLRNIEDADVTNTLAIWNSLSKSTEPSEASKHIQRAWDSHVTTTAYNKLLVNCSLPVDEARLRPSSLRMLVTGCTHHLLRPSGSVCPTKPSEWQLAFALAPTYVNHTCASVVKRLMQ